MTSESATTTTYLAAGLPGPDQEAALDATFWEGLRAHELRVQACADCGTAAWPPEDICAACHSFERKWVAASGNGHVYAWTRVWHPVHPALVGQCPYLVAVVELDDYKTRIVGNLLGDPQQVVEIGMPVKVTFEDHEEGYTLAQWTPAG